MKFYLDSNHRLGNEPPRRVAIVRSLPGLGDLLCFVPALRALRTALPEAEIILIGLPSARSFVQRFNHYIDDLLEFPGYPGIPEVPLSPQAVVFFLTYAQQLKFDLALQMHGNGSCTNSFTLLLGAKLNAGFFSPGCSCPDPDYFLPYPEAEPEIWRHLRLLEFLGVPLCGDHLEFPILQSDRQALTAIAALDTLASRNYVCIHPGASVSSRRWSCQNFAEVADSLAAQGLQVVLTGNHAEAELTHGVAQAMRFPAIDLAGQTSLGAIAALLKNARLLICNDTGISHLAAALQVSSVVIFSNSDPQRWAPLNRQRHRVVQGSEGVPSTAASTTFAPPTPQAVLTEARALLKEVAYAS
jgi:ADP-heptose:LPS heptosyltransferase